jgi:4-amino-4-deoxy-L-arabinose transferase-like glycosyltransferase
MGPSEPGTTTAGTTTAGAPAGAADPAPRAAGEPRPARSRPARSRLARAAAAVVSPAALGAVLLIAAGAVLRLTCIRYGLPFITHPDEPSNVTTGQTMSDTGTWNPHSFNYPSMLYEVIAAAAWLHGWVTGRHTTGIQMQSMGTGITTEPSLFLALRGVTALLSLGMCLLVYLAVRRVTGQVLPAVLAGLLLAVSPLTVANGVMISPDTYAGFFTALALVGALAVARRGRLPDYLLAGAAAGLAAAAKYNAVVVAVAVLAAHLVRPGRYAWRRPAVLASGAAAVAAFVAVVPAMVLATGELVRGALVEVHHYATGHPGSEGGTAPYYLRALGWDGLLLAGGVLSAALLRGRYRREVAVVLPFAVAYAGLLSVEVVHFARNLLPLLPALAFLTGLTVAAAAERIRRLRPAGRRILAAALVLAAAGGLGLAVAGAAAVPRELAERPRFEAADWLLAHVPAGSKVITEWYSPYLPPNRYRVRAVSFAVGRTGSPAGVAAVVVTERGSGRFLAQPDRYPRQVAGYRALRARYCLAGRWTDGPWVEVLVRCR